MPTPRPLAPLVLVVVLLATGGRAAADELSVDLRTTAALTALAAAAGAGLSSSGPTACLICSGARLDAVARDLFRLRDPEAADNARRASDIVANAVLPAAALAASTWAALDAQASRVLLEDALVIAEAVAIARDVNDLAKGLVARPRPSDAGATGRSFYSSHTSRAFSLAVAAATVSTIRGRRHARWMWGAGLVLASGVGYLRLAGDAHWLTDVAAGAATGSAIGFAVPWLLHRRGTRGAAAAFAVVPAPGGLSLVF